MKSLKDNTLYVAFTTAFGWFMQSVQVDPRIRLAMLFMQAVTHAYATARRMATPDTVDKLTDFLQTAMKPRKNGRDDQYIDSLNLYLGMVRANTEAIQHLKNAGILTNIAFWDLVLVTAVVKEGRLLMDSMKKQGLITDMDFVALNNINGAIQKEINLYASKCKFPDDNMVDAGVEIMHQASLFIALGQSTDDIAETMKDSVKGLETVINQPPSTTAAGSGTAAATTPGTESQGS